MRIVVTQSGRVRGIEEPVDVAGWEYGARD